MRIGKLAGKQVLGAIVAAILLAVIFVPFQKAEAFDLNVSIPSTFNQSTAGQAFSLVLNVGPGEFVSIDTITIIIDGGSSAGGKTFVFDSSGNRISGTPAAMISSLTISAPTGSDYAYGFGLVSNYAISSGAPYGYGFIGGGGPTDFVSGFAGPATITISGTVKTALLVTGGGASSHTIQASIDTSAASTLQHLVSLPVSFTVNPVVTIGTESVPGGGGTKTVTVNTPSGNTIIIQVSNVNTGGNAVVEKKTKSQIKSEIPTIFTTTTSTTGTFSLGTSTFQTSGELFDIDLSGLGTPGVDFNFPVDVTISYDDTGLTLAQEQQIKFMHWTGTAWQDVTAPIANNPNVSANTITGRLNSLSPVVAAISTTTTPPSGGGGQSGGAGRTVILNNVLPESHFALFPLDRVQVASSAFLNAAGLTIAEARVNQQISVSAEFTNYQAAEQNYAFIVQVTGPEGFVTDIRWQENTLESGQTTQVSTSVTLENEGVYTVKIFVWDGVSGTPKPLSEATVKNLQVTE